MCLIQQEINGYSQNWPLWFTSYHVNLQDIELKCGDIPFWIWCPNWPDTPLPLVQFHQIRDSVCWHLWLVGWLFQPSEQWQYGLLQGHIQLIKSHGGGAHCQGWVDWHCGPIFGPPSGFKSWVVMCWSKDPWAKGHMLWYEIISIIFFHQALV